MTNPVILTMFNETPAQLELSKRTLASIFAQDVGPLHIIVLNNGSAPETQAWLESIDVPAPHVMEVEHSEENISPLKLGNAALAGIFSGGGEYVLSTPNDVIMPPNLYREMLTWPQEMVAAGMHGADPPVVMQHDEIKRVHGDIHFSVVMTRKSAYEKLMAQDGYFSDEGIFLYASDCDLKVRMAKVGVTTAQTDILCYHYGSASWRLASPFKSIAINRQADEDRDYFARKWGFAIGSPEYGAYIAKLREE